jgi:nucleoside diphosphate kinase
MKAKQLMSNFYDVVLDWYMRRTPDAALAYRMIDGTFDQIDHVAFRTFNAGSYRLNVLEQWLFKQGYVATGDYNFEAKHVRARSYSNHTSKIPRVFLSELQINKLTKPNQNIINSLLLHCKSPEAFPWCHMIWPRVTQVQYESLLHESEYAAWVATNGLMPNHLAVALSGMNRVSHVVNKLEIHKIKVATVGGKVKGGPALLLEQAATLADTFQYITEDNHVIAVPSAYAEFTYRWPDDHGVLFDGFVEPNANMIFESTDLRREKALCVIKPDAVSRGLLSQLLLELLERGFVINDIKRIQMQRSLARELYKQHAKEEFFEPLVSFMSGGSSYVIELEGVNCCALLRQFVIEIRTRLGMSKRENVLHGSDSPDAGKREVAIFFP